MANIYPIGVVSDSSSMRPQGNHLFRKRWGQIDWRKIASVDVDKVAQELDFQVLQDNIMSVAFCNVEIEFQGVDPNFVKLFRIGQLIIEYLLHSQQYLGKQSSLLEQQCVQLRKEQMALKEEFEKLKEEKTAADGNLKTLQKENRKRRKVIEAYQDMMKAGATGLHPCPVCKREFISMEYLKSHMERRHPDAVPEAREQKKTSHEELETRLLQQVFDHLHTSENQLREEIRQKEINTKESQAAQLNQWKEMELKRLLADYQDKFEEWKMEESKKMKAAQILENEGWKVEEREKIMLEHQELRKPILQELDQLREENLTLQKEKLALELALQRKEEELVKTISSGKRHSHIGHLEDAKEIQLEGTEVELKNKSDSEILSLKETMEQEVTKLRALVKKRDTYWKSRLKELHHQSIAMATSKAEIESSRPESTLVSQEIESLKLKQQQQEQLLQTQHDELEYLRKQESSKVKSRTDDREDERALVHVLDDKDSQTDGIDSAMINGENPVEFKDKFKFSPIKHRPMIKTMYPHSSSDMEIIRQQTHALFVDTLSERNIDKDQLGLTAHELEAKMTLLQEERKKTRNSNYDEHRKQVCEKLEEYCSKGFLQTSANRQQSHHYHDRARAKVVTGKPPKPSTVASFTTGFDSQTGRMFDDSESLESESSVDTSLSCDNNDGATHFSGSNHNGILVKNLSAPTSINHRSKDSDTHLEDGNTDKEMERQLAKLSQEDNNIKDMKENGTERFFSAITGYHQPSMLASEPPDKKADAIKVNDCARQEDSPWDSSDDNSVKETVITAPRTASTPLKVKGLHQKQTTLAENIGAPPDNVSLGSFDLSSSNELESNPPHKVMTSSNDKLTMLSKNATSQSALTNISLDEFDLSDLSDIL